MKRALSVQKGNEKPAKRQKRSDISKDSFEKPTEALRIIQSLHADLTQNDQEVTSVLTTSYTINNSTQLELAKTIMTKYGFVKIKTDGKVLFDSGSNQDVTLKMLLAAFYGEIKEIFQDAYELDISEGEDVLESRKGKANQCWPTSLNIGKIGPIHMVPGGPSNTDSKIQSVFQNGISVDLINHSIMAYYIKAYFCYDVFAEFLSNKKLLTSTEPTTMVFPSIKRGSGYTTKALNNHNIDTNDEVDTTSSIVPLTRLVYGPGVLAKPIGNDNKPTMLIDKEPGKIRPVDNRDVGYDILKCSPYCGILAVTEGDAISLVPGAHRGFSQLLEYMQKTRHTDKRTIFASTPPIELDLDAWLVQIPLKSGELLIYDRRIPHKTNPISKPFMKSRTNQFEPKTRIEPFIGINVSFLPNEHLTNQEMALRSIAFMEKRLGSGLRVFGHVENTKRRGIPITVDSENPIKKKWLRNRLSTSSDPLIRKIIGIDPWP